MQAGLGAVKITLTLVLLSHELTFFRISCFARLSFTFFEDMESRGSIQEKKMTIGSRVSWQRVYPIVPNDGKF